MMEIPGRVAWGRAWAVALCVLVSGVALSLAPPPARAQTYTPHEGIYINGNGGFSSSAGVVSGSGTTSDPYVISGWEITTSFSVGYVDIENTNAPVILRDMYIHTSISETFGIWLANVTNVVIEDVHTSGTLGGIYVRFSTNVTLQGNAFDRDGVFILGDSLDQYRSVQVSSDNTVNGRPLRFYKDCRDLSVSGVDVGQLIVVNCTNVRVTNLDLGEAILGIELAYVHGATVSGITASGQHWDGLYAIYSDGLTIVGNRVTNVQRGTEGSGITLVHTSDGTVASNSLSGNVHAFTFVDVQRVQVVGNSITSSVGGAFYLDTVDTLEVFHNDFIGNDAVAVVNQATGTWDAGYPAGGNYWSSDAAKDLCNGPRQDVCSGPDGILDSPHVVLTMGQSAGTDNYPLARPYLAADLPPPELPIWILLVAAVSSGLAILATVLLVLLRRRRK